MSDWEKSVIATVMADPPSIEVAGDLRPSDFTGPNQIIWAEMLVLSNRGSLEPRSLINALRSSQDWPRLSSGGTPEDYLAQIMNFRGSHLKTYVDAVLDAAIKRALQMNAALIAAEADDNRRTAEELLDNAESRILSLRRSRSVEGMSMGDLIGIFIPRVEGMRDGSVRPAWTPDVLAVREVIQYAEKTEYILIAGRPGDGKSSYLRHEAAAAAARGQHVTIFNAENDEIEYPKFLVARQSGIDSALLKDPRLLSRVQLERVKEAARAVGQLPIRVYNAAGWTAAQIARAARKSIMEDRTKMIMMDYIQLISNGIENRVLDIAESSRLFRVSALQYGVPWMVATQLNREIERRNSNDANPRLADLRDSGSLEQDATMVIFPRTWSNPGPAQIGVFPENKDPQGHILPRPVCTPVWFHILKNRNGGIGVSSAVKWSKHLDRYETLAPGWDN